MLFSHRSEYNQPVVYIKKIKSKPVIVTKDSDMHCNAYNYWNISVYSVQDPLLMHHDNSL